MDYEERLREIEARLQILAMASQNTAPSPGMYHLGRAMLNIGFSARDIQGYYRLIDDATGDRHPDQVYEAFRRHFPNLRPEHLLEIGVAHHLDTDSPMSKLFMEAALREMRKPPLLNEHKSPRAPIRAAGDFSFLRPDSPSFPLSTNRPHRTLKPAPARRSPAGGRPRNSAPECRGFVVGPGLDTAAVDRLDSLIQEAKASTPQR